MWIRRDNNKGGWKKRGKMILTYRIVGRWKGKRGIKVGEVVGRWKVREGERLEKRKY